MVGKIRGLRGRGQIVLQRIGKRDGAKCGDCGDRTVLTNPRRHGEAPSGGGEEHAGELCGADTLVVADPQAFAGLEDECGIDLGFLQGPGGHGVVHQGGEAGERRAKDGDGDALRGGSAAARGNCERAFGAEGVDDGLVSANAVALPGDGDGGISGASGEIRSQLEGVSHADADGRAGKEIGCFPIELARLGDAARECGCVGGHERGIERKIREPMVVVHAGIDPSAVDADGGDDRGISFQAEGGGPAGDGGGGNVVAL